MVVVEETSDAAEAKLAEKILLADADGHVMKWVVSKGEMRGRLHEPDNCVVTWLPDEAPAEGETPRTECGTLALKSLLPTGLQTVALGMDCGETCRVELGDAYGGGVGRKVTGALTMHWFLPVHELEGGGLVVTTALPEGAELGPELRPPQRRDFVRDDSVITVRFRETPGHGVPGAGSPWQTVKWQAKDGTVMEGLEVAALKLAVRDRAWVTMRGELTLPDVPPELPEGVEEDVFHLEVEIMDSRKVDKDKTNARGEERLANGQALREQGTALYKAGRVRRARVKWEAAVSHLNMLAAEDKMDDGSVKSANEACMDCQKYCYLNLALVKIAAKEYKAAEDDCIEALDIDKKCVKALFRRGLARIELEKWAEAEADLKQARRLGGAAVKEDVTRELVRLSALHKEQNGKDIDIVGGMFEENDFYDESEVAPVGEAYPMKGKDNESIKVMDVLEEINDLEEEDEDVVRMKKQEYYNNLIQSGQVRLYQPGDDDDDKKYEESLAA